MDPAVDHVDTVAITLADACRPQNNCCLHRRFVLHQGMNSAAKMLVMLSHRMRGRLPVALCLTATGSLFDGHDGHDAPGARLKDDFSVWTCDVCEVFSFIGSLSKFSFSAEREIGRKMSRLSPCCRMWIDVVLFMMVDGWRALQLWEDLEVFCGKWFSFL